MRKIVLIFAAVLACALPATADQTVRTLEERFPTAGVDRIWLQLINAALRIEAADVEEVQVHIELDCESAANTRCVGVAKGMKLASSVEAGKLRVRLEGWPRHRSKGLNVRARIYVPKDVPLNAWLDVGHMTISGLESDLLVNMDVGNVDMVLPYTAVASVNLDAGVGKVDLDSRGTSIKGKGFVTQKLRWVEGAGKAAVRVDCGVGNIHVRLQ